MEPTQKKLSPRIIIALIIGVILIGSGLLLTRKHTKNVALVAKQQEALSSTIAEISGKDSNGNGIADWEETLYGLNPEKDGPKNKAIIDAKKKELGQNTAPQSLDSLSETEKFSREFFSAIQALQASGSLTPETIAALTVALTKDMAINADKKYATKYTNASMRTTIKNDPATITKYLTTLGVIAKKYQKQDIGIEAKSITIALSESDPRPLLTLGDIALSYKNFAKEVSVLIVPSSLSVTHFNLVSSADTIANTLPDIKQILSNSLAALPALSVYTKQSSLFTDTLQSITRDY